MTDTIKISRELAETLANHIHLDGKFTGARNELRALLAKPSEPQGGEEVEVVAVVDEADDGKFAEVIDVPGVGCTVKMGDKLMTVAQHQRIVAAMAVEVERLREQLEVAKTDELNAAVWAETESIRHDRWDAQREREALRAELDAIRKQEPVARVGLVPGTDFKSVDFFPDLQSLPVGMQLYAAPPAAQDASGLVELLSWLRGAINCNAENDTGRHGVWFSTKHPMIQRIDAALAVQRQAQQREGKA
jgi:hypothetical protein